jgi:transcriptional regulator with GAF, ATPase, and Fis domain
MHSELLVPEPRAHRRVDAIPVLAASGNRSHAFDDSDASECRSTYAAFEPLLSEIAEHLNSRPPGQLSAGLGAGLRRLVDHFGLDRASIFQMDDNGQNVALTHCHPVTGFDIVTQLNGSQVPWTFAKLLAGEIVYFSRLDELPAEAGRDREAFFRVGTRSGVAFPLSTVGSGVIGVMTFSRLVEALDWQESVIQKLRVAAQVFAGALGQCRTEERLREARQEIDRLSELLQKEPVSSRPNGRPPDDCAEIVGQSDGLKKVLAQVRQVAATDATVLLLGETGTGKELLATAIHDLSPRRERPMVKVNCAALPATLVESELFGREKGAYTGALSRQLGRFEMADGSTIFLDEIGDLSPEVQIKLLRFLQEGILERVGSPRPIRVRVRVIAATNRDLAEAVRLGRFREDLFYRLNVFPITVPPLRERPEDIPLLVWQFIEQFCKSLGKSVRAVAEESMDALRRYPWPGNVRELRNVIERAMIAGNGPTLRISLPTPAPHSGDTSMALADVEQAHIRRVLDLTGWRVRGSGGAAELMHIKPTTLESRMAKYGILRPC